jgi:drug/metabolite transporter (DMT)-like permease
MEYFLATNKRDLFKLHFIIFLWGFTGILGNAISLDAWHLVFFRTLIAAGFLGIAMKSQKLFRSYAPKAILEMLAVGVLVGLHWVCFFAAIKMGGVSVGMVGISTMAVFTALLEPLIRGGGLSRSDVFFGLCAMAGIGFVAACTFEHIEALAVSVFAAILAAVFTLQTVSMLEKSWSPLAVTFYQMIGAVLVTGLVLVFLHINAESALRFWPSSLDWFYLLLLGGICTAYAATACNELLKRISAFTCNLSLNMEPVYGILLAAVLLGEHKSLTAGFYVGFAIIIAAVFTQFYWQNTKKLS